MDLKKFLYDVGWTFISSMISLVFGFVITILLCRLLGVEDLGLYRMVYSLYGLISVFISLGIPAAVTKFTAEYKNDQVKVNRLVTSGVLISVIIGLICTVGLFVLSGQIAAIFKKEELTALLMIISPIFPFYLTSMTLLGYNNGMRKMKVYATATIILSVLLFVLTIAFILLGWGAAGTILAVLLSMVGQTLYLVIETRKYVQVDFRDYVTMIRNTIDFGLRMFVANSINQINYQADILLIGYFLTSVEVGYYSIAIVMSTFFWLIPQSIQMITYPAISEYWMKKDHSSIDEMITISIKYSCCILLPIGMGMILFSNLIITSIYGQEFVPSILPLQILLVGTLINGTLQRPIGSILYSIGKPNINLKIFSMAAVVNLILNLTLIPILGINGAAMATTVSYILITILIQYYTRLNINYTINTKWYAQLFAIFVAFMLPNYFIFTGNFAVNLATLVLFVAITWLFFVPVRDKDEIMKMLKVPSLMLKIKRN